MSKRKLTFEQAMKQLEEITQQIEQGQIGLEESIARYEEGMSLIKLCKDILSKAELRIQTLPLGHDTDRDRIDGIEADLEDDPDAYENDDDEQE